MTQYPDTQINPGTATGSAIAVISVIGGRCRTSRADRLVDVRELPRLATRIRRDRVLDLRTRGVPGDGRAVEPVHDQVRCLGSRPPSQRSAGPSSERRSRRGHRTGRGSSSRSLVNRPALITRATLHSSTGTARTSWTLGSSRPILGCGRLRRLRSTSPARVASLQLTRRFAGLILAMWSGSGGGSGYAGRRGHCPSDRRSARALLAAVRDWFEASFEAPTDAQAGGWAAIAERPSTRSSTPRRGAARPSPRSCGRLDRLAANPSPTPTRETPGTVRVLYVSPLKALTYDVERNLRAPLTGIAPGGRSGSASRAPDISVASRTGDTPPEDRREIARRPPDILITTPEIAVPDADQRGPRGPARRRVRHRRRGPRDRRLEARRAPRAQPRAPRAPARRRGARRRPMQRIGLSRHATAARDDRPVPRRDRAGPRGRRSSMPARASRSSSRSSSRSTTWPRSARSCRSRSSPAARPPAATCGRASGRRSTRGSSS